MGKSYWLKVGPAMDLLVQKYPKAFFPKDSPNTKPLMRGIFTLITGQNRDIPRAIIREVLRRYTLKDRYLRALVTCSHRISLEGSEVEPVSDKHRGQAMQALSARQTKRLAA